MKRAAARRPFHVVPGGKLIVVSGAAIHQLQRGLIKIILLVLVGRGVQLAALGCGNVEIIRLHGHPPNIPTLRCRRQARQYPVGWPVTRPSGGPAQWSDQLRDGPEGHSRSHPYPGRGLSPHLHGLKSGPGTQPHPGGLRPEPTPQYLHPPPPPARFSRIFPATKPSAWLLPGRWRLTQKSHSSMNTPPTLTLGNPATIARLPSSRQTCR
jgi:hypothetical protein